MHRACESVGCLSIPDLLVSVYWSRITFNHCVKLRECMMMYDVCLFGIPYILKAKKTENTTLAFSGKLGATWAKNITSHIADPSVQLSGSLLISDDLIKAVGPGIVDDFLSGCKLHSSFHGEVKRQDKKVKVQGLPFSSILHDPWPVHQRNLMASVASVWTSPSGCRSGTCKTPKHDKTCTVEYSRSTFQIISTYFNMHPFTSSTHQGLHPGTWHHD